MSKEIEWELLRLTFLIKVCPRGESKLLEFLKQGLKKKPCNLLFQNVFHSNTKF